MGERKTYKRYSNAHFQPAAQGGDEWGRHIFGPRWNLIKWINATKRNTFGELMSFTAVFHDGHVEHYVHD